MKCLADYNLPESRLGSGRYRIGAICPVSCIPAASDTDGWRSCGWSHYYVLLQVEAPHYLCNRPLSLLRLRQEHGVQIILIERAHSSSDDRFVFPASDTELNPGDRIVIFGRREDVTDLSSKLR